MNLNLALRLCAALAVVLLCGHAVARGGDVVDSFESTGGWEVLPSDGVKASIAAVDRGDGRGKAMRVDWNFEAGSGFVVVRKKLDLALAENYRFAFDLRGEGPKNNLEFKLVDPAGDNVWWVNKRAMEWPSEWKHVSYRARHFSFAWGPSGGKKLERIGAIEIAIAAAEGGKGSVWLDDLTFEKLPPEDANPPEGRPTLIGGRRDPASAAETWTQGRGEAGVLMSFGRSREIGGVELQWVAGKEPAGYRVETSDDGTRWSAVAAIRGGDGGHDWVPTPEAEGKFLRLLLEPRTGDVALKTLTVRGPEFSASPNAFMSAVAKASPRGAYPRYFLGEQTAWTVIGVPGDRVEGLMSEDGIVELGDGRASVEPYLIVEGKMLTWAEAQIVRTLPPGGAPIPTAEWTFKRPGGDLKLVITAWADGPAGASLLHTRYNVVNLGGSGVKGTLVLALRPFQVLPPWHELNRTGGVVRLPGEVGVTRDAQGRSGVWVDGAIVLAASPAAERAWAGPFAAGELAHSAQRQRSAADAKATAPDGLAAAELEYSFDLSAGHSPQAERAVLVTSPLAPVKGSAWPASPESAVSALSESQEVWDELLNKASLKLPDSARAIEETFRTQQAHILINMDGPAIQPGSRTYERSWIRDGCLTGTALLVTGHGEEFRAFIDWYAGFQYDSGKVPCVVDRRGPDPVAENDSHGEYIYAVWKYYSFTRDDAFLKRHWPRVKKAVAYIESLRAQRMTDEYKNAGEDDLRRAMYGLVPESISHEGYSAKPMHSYWDGFWTIRGLSDAVLMAAVMHDREESKRLQALADDYRACMYGGMKRAMKIKGIDYIPGCVELGDFDATSTAIGLWPCGEMPRMPEAQTTRTFEKYWKFFQDRREGTAEWKDYTPYELRIANSFTVLSTRDVKWRDRAQQLLEFFLKDQRPGGWNQWGEVVFRDKAFPGFIGDYPHTWVGSEFVNTVRDMLVMELESENLLFVSPGVPPAWAAGGVRIERFPTKWGPMSYSLKTEGDVTRLSVECEVYPPSGLMFVYPDDRKVMSVTIDGTPTQAGGGRMLRFKHGRTVEVRYRPPAEH